MADDATKSAGAADADYELEIGGGPDGAGCVIATLISPGLDHAMHPKGRARVVFACRDADANRTVLTAFQVSSMHAYLREQAAIRRAIEGALDEMLTEWDADGRLARGRAVWRQFARIAAVCFEHRQTFTPADERRIASANGPLLRTKRQRDRLIAARRASADTADTASRFEIHMANRWDLGHQFMLDFRDAKLLKWWMDG